MAKYNFRNPPTGDEAQDLLVECEGQLRPMIDEIVLAAVEAGWSREDVLLSFVGVSWGMYEDSHDDIF